MSMLNKSSAFIASIQSQFVYDNFGLKYYLKFSSSGSVASFRLYRSYRNVSVASARLFFSSPDSFLLSDISVVSSVFFESLYSRFLDVVFLSTHWFEPKNYQKRGLGTSLLRIVVDYSRSSGAKSLCGSLAKKDISNNPGLKDWYLKNGFFLFSEIPRSYSFSGIGVQISL